MLNWKNKSDKLPEDFKYWAFISYSHQDRKWGEWLHKTLESYRIPRHIIGTEGRDGPCPPRIVPVFRDQEELPTSSDLGTSIESALQQSRNLIVICSPRSARSIWVNKEVLSFKQMGREDRIHCLIVDGEPNASDKPEIGKEECFCESLRYGVNLDGTLSSQRTEPIAADIREGRSSKSDVTLKLIAGVLGIGFDELKRRDHQRRQRRLLAVVAVSISIAVSAITLSYFAVSNWRSSVARSLPYRALNLNSEDPINAMLLGVQAVNLDESPAAINALYQLLKYNQHLQYKIPLSNLTQYPGTHYPDKPFFNASGEGELPPSLFSPTGKIIAIHVCEDKNIVEEDRRCHQNRFLFVETTSGLQIGKSVTYPSEIEEYGITFDDKYFAMKVNNVDTKSEKEVYSWRLWDIRSGGPVKIPYEKGFDPIMITGPVGFPCAVSHSRRSIACVKEGQGNNYDLQLWRKDLKNNKFQYLTIKGAGFFHSVWPWHSLSFSKDDKFVNILTGSEGNRWGGAEIFKWHISDSQPLHLENKYDAHVNKYNGAFFKAGSPVVFSDAIQAIGVKNYDGSISLTKDIWKKEISSSRLLLGESKAHHAIGFDAKGRYLKSFDGKHVSIFDMEPSDPLYITQFKFNNIVQGISLHSNPNLLAVMMNDRVEVWDIDNLQLIKRLSGSEYRSLSFNPIKPNLAILTKKGIDIWNFEKKKATLVNNLLIDYYDLIAFNSTGRNLVAMGSGLAFEEGDKFIENKVIGRSRLQIWDTDTFRERFSLTQCGVELLESSVEVMAINTDSTRVAVRKGSDARYSPILFSVDKLKEVRQSDGSVSLSGGDPVYLEPSDSMRSASGDCLSFSPDGHFLAYPKDNSLKIYDVWKNKELIIEMIGHEEDIDAVSFDPTGRFLVSSSIDKLIIRDAKTFEVLRIELPALKWQKLAKTEKDHDDGTPVLRFSPDGKMLAYNTDVNTVTIWDMDVESWKRKACRKVGRNLDRLEWNKFIGRAFFYEQTCPEEMTVLKPPDN